MAAFISMKQGLSAWRDLLPRHLRFADGDVRKPRRRPLNGATCPVRLWALEVGLSILDYIKTVYHHPIQAVQPHRQH